jgi:hypothetical protein
VPTLSRIDRVLCSEPLWKPTGVWASTMAAFEDDRAERRQLRFGARQLNIYAMELRIPDVESVEAVTGWPGVSGQRRRIRCCSSSRCAPTTRSASI